MKEFKQQISWISSFANQTQTTNADWEKYNDLSRQIAKASQNNTNAAEIKKELRYALAPVMTEKTLQGFVYKRPHGYAGDYEIIDKFYTLHKSPDTELAKWDTFLHGFPAVKAVRNRKEYIKDILKEKCDNTTKGTFEMLNLASGPARDLYEFFIENPQANFQADCIDLDNNAIQYAKELLNEHNSKVNFINKNILRFNTDKQYDLVWSAGLFDYFDEEIFKRLITRFLKNVKPGGELIVGNFCSTNPNMDYMELLDWILYHRSPEQLVNLAMACGVSADCIAIEKEEEGVNLFIRIKV